MLSKDIYPHTLVSTQIILQYLERFLDSVITSNRILLKAGRDDILPAVGNASGIHNTFWISHDSLNLVKSVKIISEKTLSTIHFFIQDFFQIFTMS